MSSIYINGENITDVNTYLNSFLPSPFSKSSSDNYIKTTLEGYNTSTDIYKLFQYYDFCILINKASNLKDDNKRICNIITPWNTTGSG